MHDINEVHCIMFGSLKFSKSLELIMPMRPDYTYHHVAEVAAFVRRKLVALTTKSIDHVQRSSLETS